jgi:ubiquinone/menaquinone biosynthesis C-methylase UbiE
MSLLYLNKGRNIEKKTNMKKKDDTTHWDSVAKWYDNHLEEGADTLQAKVIAPNLLRILAPSKHHSILDLACGQGYFTRLVEESGARVTGIDLSAKLIASAKKKDSVSIFKTAPAHKTGEKDASFDTVFTVLAFENITNIDEVVGEIARVMKKSGRFVLVLLHPAFRIPKHADWGFDEAKKVQYRTVDKYLSEISIPIEQAPFKGEKSITTTTFHRPLQWYMKIFRKHGLVISGMEEWISHKVSQSGPRQKAEDVARKEFPVFMCLEITKK